MHNEERAYQDAVAARVLRNVRVQMGFDRAFPTPEYLPVPWRGRVRHWLSQRLHRLADRLEDLTTDVRVSAYEIDYVRRPMPGQRPVGATMTWRRFAPLELAPLRDED